MFLLAGSFCVLNSCCKKAECPVETTFSVITFHNFSPGNLDAIGMLEYNKADTTFLTPTDSFDITPEKRSLGTEIEVKLPRPIDLNHNYEVRLIRPDLSYRITGMKLRERGCSSGCDFFRPAYEEPYQGFGEYLVNGRLLQTDRVRIYR